VLTSTDRRLAVPVACWRVTQPLSGLPTELHNRIKLMIYSVGIIALK